MRLSEGLNFTDPVADINLVVGGHGPDPIPDRAAVGPEKSAIHFSFQGRLEKLSQTGTHEPSVEL
jgi:hypothetical protein